MTFPVGGPLAIGGRVRLAVERKKETEQKVNFEGLLRPIGGTVGVGSAFAEIGPYFEIVAKNSADSGKLLDYSLYRLFRESPIMPRSVTNSLWGNDSTFSGYSAGKKGYMTAEKWAARVEKDIFDERDNEGKVTKEAKKAHVEFGGAAGARGSGGVGEIAGFEGTALGMVGKRYNREIIIKKERKRREKKGLTPLTDQELLGQVQSTRFGAQKDKGERSFRQFFDFSGNVDLFNYTARLRLEELGTKPHKTLGIKYRLPKNNLVKWEADIRLQGRDLGSKGGASGEGWSSIMAGGLLGATRTFLPKIIKGRVGPKYVIESIKQDMGRSLSRLSSAISNGGSGGYSLSTGESSVPLSSGQTMDGQGNPAGNNSDFDNQIGLGLQIKFGGEKSDAKKLDSDASRQAKGEAHIEFLNDHVLSFAGNSFQYQKAQRFMTYKAEGNEWRNVFTTKPKQFFV